MLAIVLSRRNFREYDQMITVYTKDAGKQEYLAKGIKKITSKNAAHLEPFSVVDIGTAVGKEYDYITNVQSIYYFTGIRKDVKRAHLASVVVSLLHIATKLEEPDEDIFSLTLDALQQIQDDIPETRIVDRYAIQLLDLLGFGLEDTKTADHSSIHAALEYHLEKPVPDWDGK